MDRLGLESLGGCCSVGLGRKPRLSRAPQADRCELVLGSVQNEAGQARLGVGC